MKTTIANLFRHTVLVAAIAATMTAVSASDAPPPPELRGVLNLGGQRQFALSNPSASQTGWAKIGESFEGWTLLDYRTEGEILVLRNGDRTIEITLAAATILDTGAKATLADAEELLRKMHFEEMLAKTLEQQKETVIASMKQMMAQRGAPGGVNPDDFAQFQSKVMDAMWGEMNPQKMASEVAQIYSEIFTKGELQGLSDFYSTTSGKAMIEKSPEAQKRMTQVMVPRMMAAMPKIQQMSREFAEEQRLKMEAAKAAATPDVEPAPAPAAAP
jgi:hypothetical protein